MPRVKQLIKTAIRKSIRIARKVNALRYLLDEEASPNLCLDPDLYSSRPWRQLDLVYTFCRRQLYAQPAWRYGPARVQEVAREGFEAISQYANLQDKTYCDLGCGTYHPYGISAVMFLNGAGTTIALDLRDCDKQRAAEALADLISDCICSPEKWNWSGAGRFDFVTRAQQFNMNALREGRLDDGLSGLPLRHTVTDIHNPVLKEDTIDVMTSRAVLEHFLDFRVAVDRLFALMRSGGVAFHHIDLVDHRAYTNSDYHYWSFLAEDENWSDGVVNRLRSCEIRPHFERAGFEILRYENRIGEMPKGFMNQVAGRFRGMPEKELNVTGVFCVLRKP